MRALKALVTFLLLVGILPWGAYATALSSSARDHYAQAPGPELAGGPAETGADQAASGKSKAFTPRRCRTATLPGMRCGPDLAVLSIQARPQCEVSDSVAFADGEATLPDFSQAPPRSPPRSFVRKPGVSRHSRNERQDCLMLSRRNFVAIGGAAGLAACARSIPEYPAREASSAAQAFPPVPDFYGAVPDEAYPVPAVPDGSLSPELWRQEVANPWPDRARGAIVVDPDAAVLHFVEVAGSGDTLWRQRRSRGLCVGGNGAASVLPQVAPLERAGRHDRAPAGSRALFSCERRDGPRPGQSDGRPGAVPVPERRRHALPDTWRRLSTRVGAGRFLRLHKDAEPGCDPSERPRGSRCVRHRSAVRQASGTWSAVLNR